MTNFRVLGFNHTSFTVSDLDRTVAFFVEACGFELESRAPRDPRLLERMTAIAGADVEIAFVAGPGHRIELIDEDDRRRRGLRLHEEITDPTRAHTHEHFNELRGADREERGVRLTGHRPRQ